jgi:GNAT superfamily N-acetyltransferase
VSSRYSVDDVRVRRLQPEDQAAARELVLAGLEERWRSLDLAMNPDLDDIALAYAGATFLVAEHGPGGGPIGTGALVHEPEGVARIARMSVAAGERRRGVGSKILDGLLESARVAGYRRLVLETTETWADAIAFYERRGFREIGRCDGEVHMALDIEPAGRVESPERRDVR